MAQIDTSPTGVEELVVNDSGVTRKVTIEDAVSNTAVIAGIIARLDALEIP